MTAVEPYVEGGQALLPIEVSTLVQVTWHLSGAVGVDCSMTAPRTSVTTPEFPASAKRAHAGLPLTVSEPLAPTPLHSSDCSEAGTPYFQLTACY